MPDWTYQTVFRPLLMAMGPATGRYCALRGMGLLAHLPLGTRVIQFMGHMKPDPRLTVARGGFEFRSPVGLACALDPQLLATRAFAEFGFGFLEIGPVVARPPEHSGPLKLSATLESLRIEPPRAALTPVNARTRLQKAGRLAVPVFARIEPASLDEAREMLNALADCVQGLIVPVGRLEPVRDLLLNDTHVPTACPPVLVAMDASSWSVPSLRALWRESCQGAWCQGTVVVAGYRGNEVELGKPGAADAVALVREIRSEVGAEPLVVGAVGIHAPADALDYLEAGADLVQVDTGLVFGGPGLPKRINDAVLFRVLQSHDVTRSRRPASEPWFWALLLGLSMLIGGTMAMLIAVTRVVLPYDEAMSGLTRDELASINDRLLSFMTHDRVTLSGTMLAVGIQYFVLAWWGIRRGVHWAYMALIASACSGFVSFFTFLGFGYFDPFHAFVTAVLFQLLLLTVHARLPQRWGMEMPDLWNDRRWRVNQWGQLLFVIHGAVLIVAGCTISWIGMTSVFVPDDYAFMRAAPEHLFHAHPTLVPLVAHDRATFGGMLIACGAATFLPALWGFRRGQAWLWWGLMAAGNVAYVSTILVHWTVGYHSLTHLLPAYGGLAGLWAGGLASYSYLVARDRSLERAWSRRLSHRAAVDPEAVR